MMVFTTVLAAMAFVCIAAGFTQLVEGKSIIGWGSHKKPLSGIRSAFWGGSILALGLTLLALVTIILLGAERNYGESEQKWAEAVGIGIALALGIRAVKSYFARRG